MVANIRRRLTGLLTGPEQRILAVLIVIGLLLRVIAMFAVWPVGLGIDDSAPYSQAAAHGVLSDVQAPAGYPAFLAAIGLITRQVVVVVILQHLLAVAAAIVFFVAVKRATGSGWLALLPAVGLLLGSDQIYLEHNVMSEGALPLVLASTMYASVRVLERPASWRWALAAGALIAVDGLIRSAAIALVGAVVVAVFLTRAPRRARIRAAAVVAAGCAIVLVGYAFANLSSNHEFEVGPKPGWHLYGMVAHYANCNAFRPPSGTQALCQSLPPSKRLGLNFYLYDSRSPGWAAFGYFGNDKKVGAFARQVVLHQTGQYLRNVASNLVAYFVPSTFPKDYANPLGGQGLNPALAWTRDNPDAHRLAQVMAGFFTPFHQHNRAKLRRLLGDWERVFTFGATLLTITTLLTVAALFVADPRRRALLVLFGGGGLCFLIAPSFIGDYSGRYTVPMVAPMLASAAIAGRVLWERSAAWRARAGTPPLRRHSLRA